MRCRGRPLKCVIPRPCWSSSISRTAVVLPDARAPSSAVTRPVGASKDTSSTAGGSSWRGLLVSPKAWIIASLAGCATARRPGPVRRAGTDEPRGYHSKITRYFRLFGQGGASGVPCAARAGRARRSGPVSSGSYLGAQHRRVEQRRAPARKSWAGLPPWRVVVPPVGTRKPGVPVTLRWKLRGSSATAHTASYTRRSSPTVNSGGQKAVASDEYSIFERARSTPSARICAWSKARGAACSPSRPYPLWFSRSSTGAQRALCASPPARGAGRSGARAR